MVLRRRRLFLLVLTAIAIYAGWRILSEPPKVDQQALKSSDDVKPGPKVEQGAKKSPVVVATIQMSTLKSLKLVPTSLGDAPQQQGPVQLPRIQYTFGALAYSQDERQSAVREAFEHSWSGYKKYAWLKDELAPASAGYRTTFSGWAATLIDSLDTLWLMGMKKEFEEAVAAIESIDFNSPSGLPINVFETTIRYLGGLLGAYEVSDSQYPLLLKKAIEVGDMLLEAFNTPSRTPVLRWNKITVEVAPGDAAMSELGSLSLEFIRLSQLTGDNNYQDAVQRISKCIYRQQMSTMIPGLLPTTVNARECDFSQGMEFSLGAYVDSAYEYMPKTHQLLAGKTNMYQEMYARALGPIKEHLLFRPMTPKNADILFAGTVKIFRRNQNELYSQMQHLSCFAGGMVALASRLFSQPSDIDVARKLVDGCIWASNIAETGIMPDSFYAIECAHANDCTWDEHAWGMGMLQKNSFDEKPTDKQLPMDERLKLKAERLRIPKGMTALTSREYKLRPEAIESIFVLYRITGDESLRDHAWTMFQAIVKQTRTEYAFSNIEDVTKNSSKKLDKMESYWTAETLKYFYLIFSGPDVLSLDEWVFNTEAHPFRLEHARLKT